MLIPDPRLDRAQNIRRHLSNKIGADILASAIRILEVMQMLLKFFIIVGSLTTRISLELQMLRSY